MRGPYSGRRPRPRAVEIAALYAYCRMYSMPLRMTLSLNGAELTREKVGAQETPLLVGSIKIAEGLEVNRAGPSRQIFQLFTEE